MVKLCLGGTLTPIEPVFVDFNTLPFAMSAIPAPYFPDYTFNIEDFGAREGRSVMNTIPINMAIDACSRSGGGTVLIPSGEWLTGPIHIKSNVNLHISKGATVFFSQNKNDYLPVVFTRWEGVECYNYSPLIYANGCKNIAITGKGVFDGQGQVWWSWKQEQHDAVQQLYDSEYNGIPVKDRIYGTLEAALRPQMLQLINCENVLLKDYSCQNSPFWTNHLVYCKNVIVRDIILINPEEAPNTDGLDIDSSSDIHVQGLYADVGDDAVCLKSGMNEDGWRVNRPSENIVIENCYVKRGHGGIVFGSDIGGGIKNVFVSHCLYEGTSKGIRLKSMRGRGGYVKKVWFQDIEMRNIKEDAIVVNAFYGSSSAENKSFTPSYFKDLSFENIFCDHSSVAITVTGLPEAPVDGILMENLTIYSCKGAKISNSVKVEVKNVTIECEDNPVLHLINCKKCNIQKTKAPEGTDTFLVVSGALSRDIELKDLYLGYAEHKVVLGAEVSADEISGDDILQEKISEEKDSAFTVLPSSIDGVKPHNMMKHYLENKIEDAISSRSREVNSLNSLKAIKAYQDSLKSKFRYALGAFPERTPLNPKVTGVLKRPGYHVEKVLFESQPYHYVSAICFVPESERFSPPYSAVLVPCGHSSNGKAYESYQKMGALLALNGMIALVYDPIEQGERLQVINEKGQSKYWGTDAHNRINVSSSLLGKGTATFEIWDGIRGIDYLQSRPDVDGTNIGCTGNSGGGTQTAYLMVLDDRIDAAAPSCFITDIESLVHTLGIQDAEQNIFGQVTLCMDHPDYLIMRAPKPTLIAAGIHDFFDIQGTGRSFNSAKRIYNQFGLGTNLELFKNNAGHNYNREQREAIVSFLVKHLRGKEEQIKEPEIQPFTEQELTCSPDGQVMLMKDARSVYDINSDEALQLENDREKLRKSTSLKQVLQKIREHTQIRTLDELQSPSIEYRGEFKSDGVIIKKMIFHSEEGIVLPALFYVPEKLSERAPVLYLHELGKNTASVQGSIVTTLVKKGIPVLALDVRGCGETSQKEQKYFSPEYGKDGRDVMEAYLLGKSYVSMRCEDILTCSRWLSGAYEGRKIDLLAYGNVGVPALHAAALENELFNTVKLENMIRSWKDVVLSGQAANNQMVNLVYRALLSYDLPYLVSLLPPGSIAISYLVN